MNRPLRHLLRQLGGATLLTCAVVAAAAQTQTPSAKGADKGADKGAEGPRPSMPMARWGSDFTPGWSLMSEQERLAHREHMRSMNDYGECRSFHEKHHEQMMSRAKERRAKVPMMPMSDPCAGLKPR